MAAFEACGVPENVVVLSSVVPVRLSKLSHMPALRLEYTANVV